jgi:hypothetical protein
MGAFSDDGESIQSAGGLMYIKNPNETYSIVVRAQIIESGTYGGYGVLVDSTASNLQSESDSGYIVQFDRGYASGEIIIRPRIDGKEKNPVYRYAIRFDSLGLFTTTGGTKNNTNPWWMDEHKLTIVVAKENESIQEKSMSIYVDDIFLFKYVYTTTLFDDNAENNLTGFRAWNGIDVAFYQLTIL